MIADYNDVMSWLVLLLAIIAAGIAFDFLRTWWTARKLHQDLELKTPEDQSWFDDHFSLRRGK